MFVGTHYATDMCECCKVEQLTNDQVIGSRWLIDSGASVHICKDRGLLKNVRKVNESVVIGDGTEIVATVCGTVDLRTVGTGKQLVLSNVLFAPEFTKNIISVARLTSNGNSVSFTDDSMVIRNGRNKLQCKRDSRNGPGGMFYVDATVAKTNQQLYDVAPKENNKTLIPALKTSKSQGEDTKNGVKIDINEAHELLGHVGALSLRETARVFEWELTGQLEVCIGCTEAKAKATAVAKKTTTKATRPGERLFTDISGPYAKSIIGNKYWIMVVDDYPRMKWSFFRKKKSDIGQALDGFLTQLRGIGYETKYLRCDDAGENTRQLSDLCKRLGIKIE